MLQIRLRKRILLQFTHPYPLEILHLHGLRLTRHEFALEGVERDLEVRVGVIDRDDRLAHFDAHAELFFDLAAQALRQRLAGFDFAAGKFPQAAEPSAEGPLRDEQAAILANHGGGHIEVGQGLALRFERQLILQVALFRRAVFCQRAHVALGIARRADQRAEFHQRFVEFAGHATPCVQASPTPVVAESGEGARG